MNKWFQARLSVGLIFIFCGLAYTAGQRQVKLSETFFGTPALIFLATLIPLILLIWSLRGIAAAREGLIVLPIPIATSAIILHLIGFLRNFIPGNELANFASSLSPLVWVPFFMIIGFSLPKDVEPEDTQKKPYRKFWPMALGGLFIWLSILFWSFAASLPYESLSFSDLWPSHLILPFLAVTAGIALMPTQIDSSWSSLGASALKAGFALSALTLTTYLIFLSNDAETLAIGHELAFGWLFLFFVSLALTATHFMSIIYQESELAEGVRRNWHFLELFGFYIFLSMAPPTIFDILGL